MEPKMSRTNVLFNKKGYSRTFYVEFFFFPFSNRGQAAGSFPYYETDTVEIPTIQYAN